MKLRQKNGSTNQGTKNKTETRQPVKITSYRSLMLSIPYVSTEQKLFVMKLDLLITIGIMSKIVKPEKLDLDPTSPTAAKEWKHWK